MHNSIQIIGNLGRDPEPRHVRANGTPFTVLSVATRRSWKDAQDQWQSRTDWHRVICFNRANNPAMALHRGDQVFVVGSLRSSRYQRETAKDTLPVKQYRARRSAEITPRYFVDRFPMFVNRGCSRPVVTFTYVDAEAVTLDGLNTHLRSYSRLFQALPTLEFVYLAPTSRLFRAAESEFLKVLCGRPLQENSMDVLAYFRVRKAWDAKERVSSADVVLLKEAQRRYAGEKIEEMYRKWLLKDVADAEVMSRAEQICGSRKGSFQTILCGSSLSVFTDPRTQRKENSAEQHVSDVPGRISASQSMQISGT